jgi:hypothetical protein
MSRSPLLVHGFVVAVGLFACGPDGGGDGDVAVGDFIHEVMSAACDLADDCCDAQTSEECRAQAEGFEPLLAPFVAGLEESISEGRLAYDAAEAGSCLDSLRGLGCALAIGLEDLPCEAITPLVAEGGACTADMECTVGVCVRPPDEPEDLGTCSSLPGEGEPCQEDCAEGSYCRYVDDTWTDAVCVAARPDGASCEADSMCASSCHLAAGDADGVCGPPIACEDGSMILSVEGVGPFPPE